MSEQTLTHDCFRRVVIGVDPAVTHHENSDETGIIVAGLGRDNNFYVLEDLSGRYRPTEWAERVAMAYEEYGADRVVAEVNQGGDLVEATLRMVDPRLSYKGVRATRGKLVRAEPIAALYEKKRVFHRQCFQKLEDQMCRFTGVREESSPDRLDALVWALTELALSAPGRPTAWSL
ncbi:MAG: hypothetical protein A2621_02115 [Alphaproteobacteria bacterium RIFCSPHIGHO2_01_FULL_41_14]|nr:MAG: hypothetical protein A2065_03010 [Alphaproteobacteria bacterium GWB1_45_5]OFW76597.1 MAG: hypothetical protein A3K20_00225 [Alphaproteobacteria bacterium GWA1_45_9]OFW89681.1 MAG: hypothetical protein A2621_02115 [Alphaproteobacteria bacterium RIFCSPHIGHO2_01_FULL_41_14]HCI49123.1 hypothetical protein [Holosporales bacterium]